MSKVNFCYILFNTINQKTYVGYTNNPTRRLRQHNGELSGGARFTKRVRDSSTSGMKWEFLVLLSSTSIEFNKNKALSLEWHIKHPTGKRQSKAFQGPNGRLLALSEVLHKANFSSFHFNVFIHNSFITIDNTLPSNTTFVDNVSYLITLPLNDDDKVLDYSNLSIDDVCK